MISGEVILEAVRGWAKQIHADYHEKDEMEQAFVSLDAPAPSGSRPGGEWILIDGAINLKDLASAIEHALVVAGEAE